MHDTAPITSKAQLIDYIAAGEKPPAQWRIGTEHEKFVFDLKTLQRAGYDGERGIATLLRHMERAGDTPIMENEQLVGWKLKDGASVTLEPGGQCELSGAPLANIHETCSEINQHFEILRPICQQLGLTMIGVGYDPISRREDIAWMPKGRYQIMRKYMPTRGQLGLDMMIRTCTVQVNLDYQHEQDMREKMRIAATFQPVVTAMCANSPFKEMTLSGFQSTRAHCWSDTDPDRTGIQSMLFEPQFGYEQWVDYALSVPMYFLYDNGVYHDVAGADFRAFIKGERNGKLAPFTQRVATMQDWEDHLTVAFPEVRLKRFIEMRGADAGRWDDLLALPAFWVGLLYDQQAQSNALALAQRYTHKQVVALNSIVPTQGLSAKLGDETVLDIARQLLAIAQQGLHNRQCLNAEGQDESHYLHPLELLAQQGISGADRLRADYIAAFHNGHATYDTQDEASKRWLLNRLRN